MTVDSSLHAITKVSRILVTSTVLMMDQNEGVKETQDHNSMLKAL